MRSTKALWLLMLPLPALAYGFLEQAKVKPWVNDPQIDHFSVCFNHSCAETAIIGLQAQDWQQVADLFSPPAEDGAEERRRIGEAIALLERLVGPKINTEHDKGGNFKGTLAEGNQQDCIDESTNTTTYLTLIQQQGLLRYHQVQETSTRGWFLMGMPHTTAVIRDRESGINYAVDSWFHDNGKPPEILPVDQWRDAWYPPEEP
jgi:hypothetical protein